MSVGCFIEKKHTPAPPEIAAALGEGRAAWDSLLVFLREKSTQPEYWKFMYGKKYGWALHFERERKLLTNLYPNAAGFTVQVNLPETAVTQALGWQLPEHFRAAIEGAFPFPEGRWIFIPWHAAGDELVFRRLLELRLTTRVEKQR